MGKIYQSRSYALTVRVKQVSGNGLHYSDSKISYSYCETQDMGTRSSDVRKHSWWDIGNNVNLDTTVGDNRANSRSMESV